MSYLRAGIGAGLQSIGDNILKWHQDQTRISRENEAIQRALAQQNIENDRAQQQLMLSANQQEMQGRLNQSVIDQNRLENMKTEQGIALNMASNLPGKPVPPSLASEWAGKPHMAAFMETKPEMYGPDDSGAMYPSGFNEAATFVVPESEKFRIAQMREAGRAQDRAARQQLLQMRMATDKELAQMVNTLGWARVNNEMEQHMERMGLAYDTLDYQSRNAALLRDMDAWLAQYKAAYNQNGLNPFAALLQGAGGVAAPPAPRPAAPGPPPTDPAPVVKRGTAGAGGGPGSPAASKSAGSASRGTRTDPRTDVVPDTNGSADPTNPAGLSRPRRSGG